MRDIFYGSVDPSEHRVLSVASGQAAASHRGICQRRGAVADSAPNKQMLKPVTGRSINGNICMGGEGVRALARGGAPWLGCSTRRGSTPLTLP